MKKNSIFHLGLIFLLAVTTTTLNGCLSNSDDPTYPELLEVARSESSISIFVSAIERSDFISNMLENVDYTFLAPNNDAFTEYLNASGYGSVDSIPPTLLNHLVNYHIQFGYAPVENIVSNYYATPSLAGYGGRQMTLLVEQLSGGLAFNGDTRLVRGDIKADNGIIHIIDQVLTLPNVKRAIEQNTQFSSLLQAMEKSDMDVLLQNSSPYTLLAPSNEAFNIYFSNNTDYANVNEVPKDTLVKLMKYHMLPGNMPLDSLSGKTFPTVLAGASLEFMPQISGMLNVGGSGDVLLGDIQTTNGIVHAIDRVLIP